MINNENNSIPNVDSEQYDAQVEDEIAAGILGAYADNKTIEDILAKNSEAIAFTQDGEMFNPNTGHFIDKDTHKAALDTMARHAVHDYSVVANHGQGSDIEPVLPEQVYDSETASSNPSHPVAS